MLNILHLVLELLHNVVKVAPLECALVILAAVLAIFSKFQDDGQDKKHNHNLILYCLGAILLIWFANNFVKPFIFKPEKSAILDGDTAQLSANYKNAVDTLECFFYDGGDIEEYYLNAEKVLRQKAEQGYTEAQFYLGYMLDPRHTKIKQLCPKIAQDSQEAKRFYQTAALSGHLMSSFYLANIYYDERDYPHAAKWYQIAADKGYKDAQYALGYMFGRGYAFSVIDSSAYSNVFDEGFRLGQAEK